MNLPEKLVLKLALGRLRRAVEKARKGGSTTMKTLDGWKTAISAMLFVIASVVMLLGGVDVRQVLLQVLEALGWGAPGAADLAFYGFVANLAIAVVGLMHKGWKAYQQWRAGVPIPEVLSTEGYVKRAIADGQLARLAPLRGRGAA